MRSSLVRRVSPLTTVVGIWLCLATIPAVTAQAASPSLTKLRGSVTKLGSINRSTAGLTGEFRLDRPLAVNRSTITVEALLDEVGGSGELLVADFPLTLFVQPGAKPKTATFETAPDVRPRVRLDIPSQRTLPASFILNTLGATIALPQNCSAGRGSTTTLTLRFTIDDGASVPVVVEGALPWTCLGKNPQVPTSLRR
ncbi:MAG: hypothetical protein HY899_06115 [Deltaproteobacteria bacterium]|nr:hypothetical protein [Deltaproteobacteria bacterium]